MDPRVIARAARAGNTMEAMLASLRRGGTTPVGRVLRLVAHRSLGDERTLTVRGRLVRVTPTGRRGAAVVARPTSREHLVSIYRAFDAAEVPRGRVHAFHRGVEASSIADDGGYFELALTAMPGAPWAGGRHEVTVRAACAADDGSDGSDERNEGDQVRATADVFVPGPNASLLVVSDLDDTAMDSHTLHGMRMLRNVLLRSASRRRALPGVPALYRALREGTTGAADNPLCYVSSGPWNLYESVVDYLDTHGLPAGAVLLNDWGSLRRGFHDVSHAHKVERVVAMLSRYPTLRALLIGDDVQEDPELYASVATRHAGRVAAIWIREVRATAARRAAIERMRSALDCAGTDLVLSADTGDFQRNARLNGWIR